LTVRVIVIPQDSDFDDAERLAERAWWENSWPTVNPAARNRIMRAAQRRPG
jgi:hypothetical protein